MKKIFLIIVIILISASIFAQDYKPHSENNAINYPENILIFNRLPFSSHMSLRLGGVGIYPDYILPLYSPEGITEITIQFFESEEYFGSIVRKKEPTVEWVATYKNSVFQSLRRKGDDNYGTILVHDGSFKKITKYDISTGKSIIGLSVPIRTYAGTDDCYSWEKNGLERIFINKKWYYSDLSGTNCDYYDFIVAGSVVGMYKYVFYYSELSDRYKRQWRRDESPDKNPFEYFRKKDIVVAQKSTKLEEKIYLNAYGIYKDFDFNNYNYLEKYETFIKYILK